MLFIPLENQVPDGFADWVKFGRSKTHQRVSDLLEQNDLDPAVEIYEKIVGKEQKRVWN